MASGGGEADKSLEIGSGSGSGSDPKLGGVGSRSAGEERYFRADKLDFTKWDLHMGQSSTSSIVPKSDSTNIPAMQEWEIDLSKLDMKHVLAHGTYGTVYRGVYAGQDVAGSSFLGFIRYCSFLGIPSDDMISSQSVGLGRRWLRLSS